MVLKIKHNEDGSIHRYKERIIHKVYEQYQGIDFNETFSPVSRFEMLRIPLSSASKFTSLFINLMLNMHFLWGFVRGSLCFPT